MRMKISYISGWPIEAVARDAFLTLYTWQKRAEYICEEPEFLLHSL